MRDLDGGSLHDVLLAANAAVQRRRVVLGALAVCLSRSAATACSATRACVPRDLLSCADRNRLERARTVSTLERRKLGGVQKRNDVRVQVGDYVYVVDAVIVEIGYIGVRLIAREKPPTAVRVVSRRLAVHKSHTLAFHRDSVGREARTVAFHQWAELSEVQPQTLRLHESPNAAVQRRRADTCDLVLYPRPSDATAC